MPKGEKMEQNNYLFSMCSIARQTLLSGIFPESTPHPNKEKATEPSHKIVPVFKRYTIFKAV